MSNPCTYLRVLNNCLSGRSKKIFPNQVVFYNALFGAINPLFLPDESLEDLNRISRHPGGGRISADDEDLIKKVNYLLRSGLDSNSANVGKHINNVPELPIPKQHMAHLTKRANRDGIVLRLQIIIRFCLSFHPPGLRMDGEDFRRLLESMKAGLAETSNVLREAETLSVELLGVVVYEVLFSHLDRLQESAYSVQEGRPRVDLQEQRREYEAKADCYRDDSMEKFFALKRLAEDNVVAAADMGNLWAMDRLARLECRKGHLQEAAGLWEQAAQMHYPAAGLHLALPCISTGRDVKGRMSGSTGCGWSRLLRTGAPGPAASLQSRT